MGYIQTGYPLTGLTGSMNLMPKLNGLVRKHMGFIDPKDHAVAWKERLREEQATEEMYPSHIIGYRCWSITKWGKLMPMTVPVAWKAPTEKAGCFAGSRHDAPNEACRCGIYACHTLKGALEHAPLLPHRIVGAVAMRGRTFVHQAGVRAEEAKVLALAKPPRFKPDQSDYDGLLKIAAHRYGAEIVDYDDLESFAERFGSAVPPSALPYAGAFTPTSMIAALRSYSTHPLLFRAADLHAETMQGALVGVGYGAAAAAGASLVSKLVRSALPQGGSSRASKGANAARHSVRVAEGMVLMAAGLTTTVCALITWDSALCYRRTLKGIRASHPDIERGE